MNNRTPIAAIMLALCLAVQPAAAGQREEGVAAYRHGRHAEALDLLQPLAAQGDAMAQFNLAVMHDEGRGLPRNYALAFKWYVKAAEQGLVDAQYAVGMFYGTGRGMKQDVFRAYVWFNIAAAGGDPRAENPRRQEEEQLSPGRTAEAQNIASRWLRQYPRQITCAPRGCINPGWLPLPKWHRLQLDLDF